MDQKTRTILAVVGLIGLAYLLARRTAAKVLIGSAAVRIHKLSLGNIELRIDLPVLNQSDIPAPVTAFLGQIMYGTSPIGIVDLVKPTDLPGFGQKIVEFRANISTVSAATAIYNILTKPPVDWSKFRIQGTLKIGPLPIDIDQQLTAA